MYLRKLLVLEAFALLLFGWPARAQQFPYPNLGGSCTNQIMTGVTAAGAPVCSNGSASGDTTLLGLGAATASAVTISSAPADIKLAELSLPAGYLNTLGKTFFVQSRGIYTTVLAQTPTITLKLKLCTVAGCGSGTVLTLYSTPASGATTASASNTWMLKADIGTTATGATGTVFTHAEGCIVLGASGGTACTPTIDANTANSSTIDLTAALFLDVVGNLSTGTTNTMTPNVFYLKPVS